MFLLAHRRWGTLGETSVFVGLFVTRTSKYTGTSSAVRVYNFFQLLWVPLEKWIYAFLFLWFKMWRISFLALFFIPKNVRRDCESVIEFDWISVSKVTSGLVFHLYHVGRSPIKSINDRCLFNSSIWALWFRYHTMQVFIPERISLKTLTWQTRIFFHTTLERRGFGTAKSQIMMPAQDSSTFQSPQVSNLFSFVHAHSHK